MAGLDFIQDTLASSVTAAAPAANTVLAVITAPPKGEYLVRARIIVTGAAETQPLNVVVRNNGVVVATMFTIQNVTDVLGDDFDVTYAGAGNIDMQVVANATAATVYTTRLEATRIA